MQFTQTMENENYFYVYCRSWDEISTPCLKIFRCKPVSRYFHVECFLEIQVLSIKKEYNNP